MKKQRKKSGILGKIAILSALAIPSLSLVIPEMPTYPRVARQIEESVLIRALKEKNPFYSGNFEKYFDRPSDFNPEEANSLAKMLVENPDAVIGTLVKKRIEFYQKPNDARAENMKAGLEKGIKRMLPYLPAIKHIFRENGVPEELILLSLPESEFRPHATSHMGAKGPFQLMNYIAKKHGLTLEKGYEESRNPILSSEAAASELRQLREKFGDWCLAMLRYNSRKPENYQKQNGGKEISCSGYFNFLGESLKRMGEKNIRIKKGETLARIAKKFGTPLEEILLRNGIGNASEIKAGSELIIPVKIKTPPDYYENINYLPRFLALLEILRKDGNEFYKIAPSSESLEIYIIPQNGSHIVSRGESLEKIARIYSGVNSSRESVKKMIQRTRYANKLKGNVILPGQNLAISYQKSLEDVAEIYNQNISRLREMNPHIKYSSSILPAGAKVIIRK
ncbi:LysM peptidoglycan-binding domain-containing protein [Candidatus Pacearchaeota archaeon]|nr:LysM peptidoglycan-binding domain-containing protein [Candidatus Pacearchaeota archaeon]